MSAVPRDPNDPSQSPYASPQYTGPPPQMFDAEGDVTGGVIPYKNMPSLLAYYFGIFSLLPCIGLGLAIPAVILDVMGLQRRKRNPAVKGSVHAWIGIVMGT